VGSCCVIVLHLYESKNWRVLYRTFKANVCYFFKEIKKSPEISGDV
jgi:hypothetical protein